MLDHKCGGGRSRVIILTGNRHPGSTYFGIILISHRIVGCPFQNHAVQRHRDSRFFCLAVILIGSRLYRNRSIADWPLLNSECLFQRTGIISHAGNQCRTGTGIDIILICHRIVLIDSQTIVPLLDKDTRRFRHSVIDQRGRIADTDGRFRQLLLTDTEALGQCAAIVTHTGNGNLCCSRIGVGSIFYRIFFGDRESFIAVLYGNGRFLFSAVIGERTRFECQCKIRDWSRFNSEATRQCAGIVTLAGYFDLCLTGVGIIGIGNGVVDAGCKGFRTVLHRNSRYLQAAVIGMGTRSNR